MRIGYFDFRETQFGIIRQITLIIISNLLMSARKHRFETIHKQRQDNRPVDDLFTQTFSMVHWVLTHIFGRHCCWVRNYSQGIRVLDPSHLLSLEFVGWVHFAYNMGHRKHNLHYYRGPRKYGGIMITNDDLVFLAENYTCNLTPIVQDCPIVTGQDTHGQCVVKLKSKSKSRS